MIIKNKLLTLICLITLSFTLLGNAFASSIKPGTKIQLRMLIKEGYAPKEYRDEFSRLMKTEYDINVTIKVEYTSQPEQYLESLRRRSHELISPTHNIFKSPRWPLIHSRLLLPLRTKNIPNLKHLVPSLRESDFYNDYDKVYAAPFLQGTYGLAYNSALVKEPKTWKVLWDPEFKGKYAVSSGYPEVNVYVSALAMGIDKTNISNVSIVNTPEFKQHLNVLSDNAARVWHGSDTAEILSGLTYATSWGFALTDLNAQGEPWKMSNPAEGSPAWVDTWALAAHLKRLPDHRWVAEQWINFVLSDRKQLGYMRNLSASPTNELVAKIATAKEVKTFHLGDRKYFKNLLFWPKLSKKAQDIYGSLWRDAFK